MRKNLTKILHSYSPQRVGDDFVRAVLQHPASGAQAGVPELGRPVQADLQAVATALNRAEATLSATGARQSVRHPDEEIPTGMCYLMGTATFVPSCLGLSGAPLYVSVCSVRSPTQIEKISNSVSLKSQGPKLKR